MEISERSARLTKLKQHFTPSRPIRAAEQFVGRQEEIHSVLGTVAEAGQHALIYGDRSIGKSSLANVCGALVTVTNPSLKLIRVACDKVSTFQSVFERILERLDFSLDRQETSQSVETELDVEGNLLALKSGAKRRTESGVTRTREKVEITPARAAEILQSRKCLIIIDEFDKIETLAEKHLFADLIKHCSDDCDNVTILLTGISDTATDLVGAHQSIPRCLKQIKLNKMDASEIRTLLVDRARATGLTFEDDALRSIVNLADGYPYYAHLLGSKCCESAILRDGTRVSDRDLQLGIAGAAKDSDESLRSQYLRAVRSSSLTKPSVDLLLFAAAQCPREFTLEMLQNKLTELGVSVVSPRLSTQLIRLTTDDKGKLIKARGHGYFAFDDALMVPFVRIVTRAGY